MSYEWITPKTDWTTTTRFEYTDYNRIRNNLLYINDMLNELYPDKAQSLDLGDAKTGYANEYAVSEFNAFEDALESFTRVGQDVNVGDRNYYRGNNSFIWADALNRLEQCCLRWYNLDPVVESATLSPSTFELQVGQTQQLILTVVPSNADYTVEYTSSTNSMTVDNTGLVTCANLTNANTVITATVKQKGIIRVTATCTAVAFIPVTGISINKTIVEGRYDTYSRVLVTVTPSNATHKDDWVITTQEKIGTKDIKTLVYKTADGSMVEVSHAKETAGGGLIFSANGVYEKLVVIDIPVTVSLDGFSATFTYSSYPRGSYELGDKKVKDSITSQECYYISSRLVKKGSNVSANATLIFWAYKYNSLISTPTGEPTGIYDDRIAPYRTAINTYTNQYFSDKLKGALQSFSKVVHTAKGDNSKASYSAKYHLLSYNEIDGKNSPSDGYYTSLGSETYPYILSTKVAGTQDANREFMLRSKFISYVDYGEESFSCNNASIGTIYNQSFGSTHPLQPIINLLGNIKLTLEGEDDGINFYSIDWTNTSNITLYNVPLGSIIADIDGYKAT